MSGHAMAGGWDHEQIQFMTAPTIPDELAVECRNHEVVQVLVNLLNNAFDAVDLLKDKWVELSVHENGATLDFVVTDSGSGVAAEIQAKLFDPFFSTKRVQYGTGLGLSISKSVIQKHNGTLFLDAECSHTRFVMRIPRTQNKAVQ